MISRRIGVLVFLIVAALRTSAHGTSQGLGIYSNEQSHKNVPLVEISLYESSCVGGYIKVSQENKSLPEMALLNELTYSTSTGSFFFRASEAADCKMLNCLPAGHVFEFRGKWTSASIAGVLNAFKRGENKKGTSWKIKLHAKFTHQMPVDGQ